MIASAMTIRAAFRDYHEPQLLGASAAPGTLSSYRCAVASWDANGFPDLPVTEIRQSHVLQWRRNVLDSGRAPATFDGQLRCIKAILNTLIAEELLDRLPVTRKVPRAQQPPPDPPSLDQINSLYNACSAATWPYQIAGLTPPQVWRCLYAVATVSALRKSDLLALRRSDNVHPEGLRVIPKKTARHRKMVLVPWDRQGVLKHHLETMRRHGGDIIFPIPDCPEYWTLQQRAIADAARVPIEQGTLQPLRQASLNIWLIADERAAGLIGGHDPKIPRVTRLNYATPTAMTIRAEQILREAAGRLELPSAMLPPDRDPQLTLF
jgi:integrase